MVNFAMEIMPKRREEFIDFCRSFAMIFVFYHHMPVAFPRPHDFFFLFNPFAELFVGLSGFVAGMVYLHKVGNSHLFDRAIRILAAYYVVVIPVSIGASFVGKQESSTFQAIVDAITFHFDITTVGILRFYAFMFLMLPLVFWLYRKSSFLLLLVLSAMFFLCLQACLDFKYSIFQIFFRGLLFCLCFSGSFFYNRLISWRYAQIWRFNAVDFLFCRFYRFCVWLYYGCIS